MDIPAFFAGRSVAIATPFRVAPTAAYVASLVKTIGVLSGMGIVNTISFQPNDTYVQRARNSLLYEFLESDFTDWFIIDSDLSWEPEDFLKVLMAPHEIVAAVYRQKNSPETWTCTQYTDERNLSVLDGAMVSSPLVHKKSGCIQASMLPTGFMRIKRTPCELLWEQQAHRAYVDERGRTISPVFDAGPDEGLWWTEDVKLSHRWTDLGGTLWIEPDVTLRHWWEEPHEGNYHEHLKALVVPPDGNEAVVEGVAEVIRKNPEHTLRSVEGVLEVPVSHVELEKAKAIIAGEAR